MVRRRLRSLIVAAVLGLGAFGAEMLIPAVQSVAVHIPPARALVAFVANTTSEVSASPPGQRSSRRPRAKTRDKGQSVPD
jgi:hypothetical protein